MKKQYFTMLLVLSIIITAYSQINLLTNTINFRNNSSANNTTYHYGDLSLSGGSAGNSWGWLYCNKAIVYGDLAVSGTKNFIQPHPTDTTKVIKYVAIESGEALTLVRGMAKTENGQVTITLPEHFTLVTSDKAPITVLLTPKRVPALLYIKEESKEKIVVGMKGADFIEFRDIDFSYQVTGVRDGFEDEAVIVDINGQENISAKRAAYNEKVKNLVQKMKNEKKNK